MSDVNHGSARDNDLVTALQPHGTGHPIGINGRDFATRND
jgi:hypothetical protein